MQDRRKQMPLIPDSEWAAFRQEFGELVGLVNSVHEQTKRTNDTVLTHTREIGELKTAAAVGKVKLGILIGGALLVIELVKDNLGHFIK